MNARDTIMPYDPDKHHRRSIRLAGYDYTQPGVYFVTICTFCRAPVLGHILNGVFIPSQIGQVVTRSWLALPHHFSRVTLDAWVVMPDHLHGLIVMGAGEQPFAATPGGQHARGTRSSSLNAMVQNFKSTSTRRANKLRRMPGAALWQRDYYERIVRSERALQAVRRYIHKNPSRSH